MPKLSSMLQKLPILFAIAMGAIATGCVNMSTLQTARALPEGEVDVVMGGGYYLSPALEVVESEDSDGVEEELDILGLPYLEVGGRIGLGNGFDLGLKLTIPGTIAIDVKYQFLDVDGFAMAAGVGLGYLHYETTSTSSDGSTDSKLVSENIDLMVPVFVSYHFNELIAMYASPKWVMRLAFGTESDPMQLLGVGGGFKVGDKMGAYLEATYMVDMANPEFTMMQVTGATFF